MSDHKWLSSQARQGSMSLAQRGLMEHIDSQTPGQSADPLSNTPEGGNQRPLLCA